MDRLELPNMNFIRAVWEATTTNAWPVEIGVPTTVVVCFVSVALFGWISLVPAVIASAYLFLLISYLGLRQHMAPSGLSFFQFFWSRPKPQYLTYQFKSSQLYLAYVLPMNMMIHCFSFYILSSVFKSGSAMAFVASVYVTQAVFFIYGAVISSGVYFWDPVTSRSEGGISISESLRSDSPKVDQFENLQDYKHIPFQSDLGFRLLLLKSGPKASPLEGELIAQSSKTIGIFAALSYTWDNQPLDRYIICNGEKLAITANCEAALRQLRRRFLNKGVHNLHNILRIAPSLSVRVPTKHDYDTAFPEPFVVTAIVSSRKYSLHIQPALTTCSLIDSI